MKVLIVDDEESIIEAVSLCVSFRWPTAAIIKADNGATCLEMVKTKKPDVVILDIGLPDQDGFQTLQQMRQFSQIPIIMLTVRDSDIDIARALQMGADDYIVKPFSHVEFLARVEALLRRVTGRYSKEQEPPLVSGDLRVDFGSAEVTIGGRPVHLTATELRILDCLMRNAGWIVTHKELVELLRGVDDEKDIDPRAIRVHMQNLRCKLGDKSGKPNYIVSVYGVGYKFLGKVTRGIHA